MNRNSDSGTYAMRRSVFVKILSHVFVLSLCVRESGIKQQIIINKIDISFDASWFTYVIKL